MTAAGASRGGTTAPGTETSAATAWGWAGLWHHDDLGALGELRVGGERLAAVSSARRAVGQDVGAEDRSTPAPREGAGHVPGSDEAKLHRAGPPGGGTGTCPWEGRDQVPGLVEEALLDELRALLRRDLDVARREHEDAVRDALHAAVEGVGQAAREVDQPPLQLVLGDLEVRATGMPSLNRSATCWASLKLFGITRCTRTPLRPLPRAAPTAPQLGRRAPGRLVVGEDVVEVVAAAAVAEAAHVGPLAVALLDWASGSVGRRPPPRRGRGPRPGRSTRAHGARSP